MNAARPQMILVAVLVCLFAVGMAGLLNFFKYRSNAERLIKERLVVTASRQHPSSPVPITPTKEDCARQPITMAVLINRI